MEKQKAQMRVEERDRRAEELKNQMMNMIPEEETVEEEAESALPFEIPGIDTSEVQEEIIDEPEEEKVEEKKDKKKTDKQVSLFSF